MKKFLLASVLAIVSIGFVASPTLNAQALALGGSASGQITIKDPAEFNAYQSAISQTDPQALANALDNFLKTYPNSVVKDAITAMLLDAWQGTGNLDKTLEAASNLLKIDSNNIKAIYLSVYIKKSQAQSNNDVQIWDDAAALGTRGLTLTLKKPPTVKDTDWSKQTLAANMLFHSVIANDLFFSKKDYRGAIVEFFTELRLTPSDPDSISGALLDMVQLADALNRPEAKEKRNPVLAIWFYARVWDFAPENYKAPIEETLEYWYKKYHGNVSGLDDIKQQASKAMFPPSTLAIDKAPTIAQQIHKMLSQQVDVNTLALSDKETILAVGDKPDADKVWVGMKDRQTPVPGVVLAANASTIKGTVTQGTKTTNFTVALKTPMDCKTVTAVAPDVKQQEDFILLNGVKEDTDKLVMLFFDAASPATKIEFEPTVSVLNMAVTDDAKQTKQADFFVNMKKPLEGREIPPVGFEYKIQNPPHEVGAELVGTYASFAQIPASDSSDAAALIVLNDGEVIPAIKGAAARPAKAAPHRRTR